MFMITLDLFSWLDLPSFIFHVIVFLILSNKEIKEEKNTLPVKDSWLFQKIVKKNKNNHQISIQPFFHSNGLQWNKIQPQERLKYRSFPRSSRIPQSTTWMTLFFSVDPNFSLVARTMSSAFSEPPRKRRSRIPRIPPSPSIKSSVTLFILPWSKRLHGAKTSEPTRPTMESLPSPPKESSWSMRLKPSRWLNLPFIPSKYVGCLCLWFPTSGSVDISFLFTDPSTHWVGCRMPRDCLLEAVIWLFGNQVILKIWTTAIPLVMFKSTPNRPLSPSHALSSPPIAVSWPLPVWIVVLSRYWTLWKNRME